MTTVTNRFGMPPRPMRGGPQTISITSGNAALAAVWVTLFAVVFREVFFSTSIAVIGSYNMSYNDPVTMAWVAAAVPILLLRPNLLTTRSILAMLLVVLVALNFATGLITNGSQAFYWFRADGAFFVVLFLACASRFSESDLRKIGSAVVITAAFLAILVLCRWVFFWGFPFSPGVVWGDAGRPLTTMGAFVVASGAILLFARSAAWDGRRAQRMIAQGLFLSIATALSGQGTATIALLAMGATLFVLASRNTLGLRLAGAIIVSSIAAGFVWMGGLDLLSDLSSQNAFLEQRSRNSDFRQLIWTAFFQKFQDASWRDFIFGYPSGYRPALIFRTDSQVYRAWEISYHSHYIGLLSAIGIAGFCVFLFNQLSLFLSTLDKYRKDERYLRPALSLALMAGYLVEGYSYELREGALVAVFLANAIPMARPSRRSHG